MNAALQTPALPRVTAYSYRWHTEDHEPESSWCACGTDITYAGYRVAGSCACCRECAVERVCELLGEQSIYDDGAEALAAGLLDGAL